VVIQDENRLRCTVCSDRKNCSHVKQVSVLSSGVRLHPAEPGDEYRKELAATFASFIDPETGKLKATSVSQVQSGTHLLLWCFAWAGAPSLAFQFLLQMCWAIPLYRSGSSTA
jgi:hypothetical protein